MVWTIVSEGSKQGANASCNESGRCDFYSGRTVDWHETTSQQKRKKVESNPEKVALLRKKNSNILFLPFLFGYIIGPLKKRIVNLLKLILRVQLCLYENIQGRNGKDSLRVLSNFGDGDCGADEIHTPAKFRGDATRRERRKLETTDKAREFELSAHIPSAKL